MRCKDTLLSCDQHTEETLAECGFNCFTLVKPLQSHSLMSSPMDANFILPVAEADQSEYRFHDRAPCYCNPLIWMTRRTIGVNFKSRDLVNFTYCLWMQLHVLNVEQWRGRSMHACIVDVIEDVAVKMKKVNESLHFHSTAHTCRRGIDMHRSNAVALKGPFKCYVTPWGVRWCQLSWKKALRRCKVQSY